MTSVLFTPGRCAPPGWLGRELEHEVYARVAAGAGDRQRKKQRCGWGKGRVRVWCAMVRVGARVRAKVPATGKHVHTYD
jgi:hypothetical protein